MDRGAPALRSSVMCAAKGRSSRTKPAFLNEPCSCSARSASAAGVACGPTQTILLCFQYLAPSIGSSKALDLTDSAAAPALRGSPSPRKASVR